MPKPVVSIMLPTFGDPRELEAWREWGKSVMQSRDELEKMLREHSENNEKKRMEMDSMRLEWAKVDADRARSGVWLCVSLVLGAVFGGVIVWGVNFIL